MLEMWKIVDPYFKTAGYYTEEEVSLDRARMEAHFRGVEHATQVTAVIDGNKTLLWKALLRTDGQISEIYFTDQTRAFWIESSLKYLQAHEKKVRVEVTAKEIRSSGESLAAQNEPGSKQEGDADGNRLYRNPPLPKAKPSARRKHEHRNEKVATDFNNQP